MKKIILAGCFLGLGACSTSDKQVADLLKKNPKLVFDTIEENPEQFIEVVNRAARKAQEGQQQKQLTEMKQQQELQMKTPLRPVLAKGRALISSPNAPITIVEYADFQCPACGMAYNNLKAIKEKYKGRINFYYKNMPLDFHKMAYPSALYYEAIGRQDRAMALKFHEYLFENQGQLRDAAFLKSVAKKIGVNESKLTADLKSPEIQKIIKEDMQEFEAFGFTGTPVILVNGVALHGAQPVEEIERVIGLTTGSSAQGAL